MYKYNLRVTNHTPADRFKYSESYFSFFSFINMEDLSSSSETDNAEFMSIASDSSVGYPSSTSWDPSNSPDWDNEKPTEQCVARIKRFSPFYSTNRN